METEFEKAPGLFESGCGYSTDEKCIFCTYLYIFFPFVYTLITPANFLKVNIAFPCHKNELWWSEVGTTALFIH